MSDLNQNKANSTDAAGVASAVIAYCFWGFMPLYWHLMAEASHVEVLAHRIIWSLLFIVLMLVFKGEFAQTLAACRTLAAKSNRNAAGIIVLASMFASLNWLINIVGVNTGRVVELGLGMFLTPLATVAIGIVFFSERLTRLRALAVGLAACSVVILAAGLDRFPWIAVGVSSTWAIYGALKKKVAGWTSCLSRTMMFDTRLKFSLGKPIPHTSSEPLNTGTMKSANIRAMTMLPSLSPRT